MFDILKMGFIRRKKKTKQENTNNTQQCLHTCKWCCNLVCHKFWREYVSRNVWNEHFKWSQLLQVSLCCVGKWNKKISKVLHRWAKHHFKILIRINESSWVKSFGGFRFRISAQIVCDISYLRSTSFTFFNKSPTWITCSTSNQRRRSASRDDSCSLHVCIFMTFHSMALLHSWCNTIAPTHSTISTCRFGFLRTFILTFNAFVAPFEIVFKSTWQIYNSVGSKTRTAFRNGDNLKL